MLSHTIDERGRLVVRFEGDADDAADVLDTHEIDHAETLGLFVVDPEDIGALTDGLILTDGDPCDPARVWWDHGYAVTDWRETVVREGVVCFDAFE